MRWLWKNKVHFAIWAVFVVYLLTASQIYAAFFLKNGKPLPGNAALPSETGEIHLQIDDLRASVVDGEELYVLSGWVFAEDIPESGSYEKKLVLHSVSQDLIFPTETVTRRELTNVFSNLNMNLDNAGFRAYISKDVLKIDNYRIGIVLQDAQGNVQAYRMVDKYIQREPNRMRYIGN